MSDYEYDENGFNKNWLWLLLAVFLVVGYMEGSEPDMVQARQSQQVYTK